MDLVWRTPRERRAQQLNRRDRHEKSCARAYVNLKIDQHPECSSLRRCEAQMKADRRIVSLVVV